MGKRTAVWPYNGTLFNDTKKQSIKAQTDMEETYCIMSSGRSQWCKATHDMKFWKRQN